MIEVAASSWKAWYHAQYSQSFATKTGTDFEDFIDKILSMYHPDYINPTPKGSLGDGGCDGITLDGKHFYAMFGYLPNRGERKLAAKIESDFIRALDQWDCFEHWGFVTNVGFGAIAARTLMQLQNRHRPSSTRPIVLYPLDCPKFWKRIVSLLDSSQLDEMFPGVPHASNLELRDIVPLLSELTAHIDEPIDDGGLIRAVPFEKMQYNRLPDSAQFEFQTGRLQAARITRWYQEQADPLLRDRHGQKFRELYLQARLAGVNTLEQLYIYVGGTDFRLDNLRANAVYAITAFFFDECDIFEAPEQATA